MAKHKGDGSVYWDGTKGRWVGALVVDGKRHRVTVTPADGSARAKQAAQVEARRRLAAVKVAAATGTATVDGNLTLGQVLERWGDKVLPTLNGKNSEPLSARTVESYRWALGVLDEMLGSRRLRTLNADMIEDAFEKLATTPERGKKNQGMSRSALIKVRSVLGQVLSYAVRRNLITANPVRDVHLPAQARRTPDGRALTVDEAKKLLAAAEGDRLHALWLLMLMLGIRPGEALGLTWADVDLDAAVVHVRRSLKLEGGRPVLDHRLKTDRARRSIDAPPPVVAALHAHRARQAAERLRFGAGWGGEWADAHLVFTSEIGTPMNPSNVRRSFTALLECADLGTMRVYDLRHSAASIMSAAGVPLERVADLLGHDGTRMAALVYRHAVKPTVDAALVMGEVFG